MRAIRCPNGQRAFLKLGVMSGTEGGGHIMGWLPGTACPGCVLLAPEGPFPSDALNDFLTKQRAELEPFVVPARR